MTDWVNTTCPCCGGPAKRETDTMPQWAGSSWYFLRYMDPHNDKALASPEALKYWSPVDWYNGGMEHTTLHLLYSRFWHKFLYDIGVVPTKEPYAKRTSHGMILGENGEKMSKSRGNVVNPDEIVDTYGADTMRLYEMFIGDFEKAAPWSPKSIKGCRRFLERVWALADKVQDGDTYSEQHEVLMNRTIKKVGEDADNLKANTAIAALMTMLNEFYDKGVNQCRVQDLPGAAQSVCTAYHRGAVAAARRDRSALRSTVADLRRGQDRREHGRAGGTGKRQAEVHHQAGSRRRQADCDRYRNGRGKGTARHRGQADRKADRCSGQDRKPCRKVRRNAGFPRQKEKIENYGKK